MTGRRLGAVSAANEAGNAVLDDVAFHWGSGDHLQYPLPYQITNPLHPGKSRGGDGGETALGRNGRCGENCLGGGAAGQEALGGTGRVGNEALGPGGGGGKAVLG